eukprot:CAMPEP_0171920800 /NCGR_PEP_ID=MMETSP0993-20121228/19567_1 /TAXON_ID=483369 /ORGANISM="non described non described, Strain CCMP2098" /LENGTH=81 /DNA_ID=CAMNT_0012557945 /DNA_START=75 /DNA_END=320 /DNA_ORIENTATION=+
MSVRTSGVRRAYVGPYVGRTSGVRRAYVGPYVGRTSGVRRYGAGPYVGSYVGSSRRTVRGPLPLSHGHLILALSKQLPRQL